MDRLKDGYRKNFWMKRIHLAESSRLLPISFLCLFCISGCASIAISAFGAGAGLGIPYVFSNCADRTVNFPFEQVNRVTPDVLKKMDITVHTRTWTKSGETILASANEVDILIEMERITNKATRITVDAKKSQFVRDKATAEEIINQLERTLAKK
jgi:hypothetical protein